jgi:hypothetical protein
MSNVKREIMAQKIKEYESNIYKHLYKISENANTFFYDILNNFSVSIWFPLLSDLLQYIHIFFYPFKENVSLIFLFFPFLI